MSSTGELKARFLCCLTLAACYYIAGNFLWVQIFADRPASAKRKNELRWN